MELLRRVIGPDDPWMPGIGDPTLLGWLTVAAYFTAAGLCLRAALRAGTEIQALGFHTRSARAYMKSFAEGVTKALDERDAKFGDYRTS